MTRCTNNKSAVDNGPTVMKLSGQLDARRLTSHVYDTVRQGEYKTKRRASSFHCVRKN